MTSIERKKTSKFKVYIGWALIIYCDNINEVNNIIHLHGIEKTSYEKLTGITV